MRTFRAVAFRLSRHLLPHPRAGPGAGDHGRGIPGNGLDAGPPAPDRVRPRPPLPWPGREPHAARGYSRDKKEGLEQIAYGMLSTSAGVPVAVRVVPGNTADPTAFTSIAAEIKDLAGVEEMVMAGARA